MFEKEGKIIIQINDILYSIFKRMSRQEVQKYQQTTKMISIQQNFLTISDVFSSNKVQKQRFLNLFFDSIDLIPQLLQIVKCNSQKITIFITICRLQTSNIYYAKIYINLPNIHNFKWQFSSDNIQCYESIEEPQIKDIKLNQQFVSMLKYILKKYMIYLGQKCRFQFKQNGQLKVQKGSNIQYYQTITYYQWTFQLIKVPQQNHNIMKKFLNKQTYKKQNKQLSTAQQSNGQSSKNRRRILNVKRKNIQPIQRRKKIPHESLQKKQKISKKKKMHKNKQQKTVLTNYLVNLWAIKSNIQMGRKQMKQIYKSDKVDIIIKSQKQVQIMELVQSISKFETQIIQLLKQ